MVIVTPVIENQILKNDIKTKKKYDWHVFSSKLYQPNRISCKKEMLIVGQLMALTFLKGPISFSRASIFHFIDLIGL